MTFPNQGQGQGNQGQDIFDPKDFVRAVSDQAKDLTRLSDRIQALEDKFGSNQKIAETLCDVAENATKMQTMLAAAFQKLLKTDDAIKTSIAELVSKQDRSMTMIYVRKFFWLIYGFAAAILFKIVDKVGDLVSAFIPTPPH